MEDLPQHPGYPEESSTKMSDRKSATDVAVATRPRSQHARESALRQDALHIQICDRVRAWPKDRRNEMQQSWTRTWIMNEHEGVRVSPGNICSAGSMVGPPPRPQANRTQSHAAKSISAPQPDDAGWPRCGPESTEHQWEWMRSIGRTPSARMRGQERAEV